MTGLFTEARKGLYRPSAEVRQLAMVLADAVEEGRWGPLGVLREGGPAKVRLIRGKPEFERAVVEFLSGLPDNVQSVAASGVTVSADALATGTGQAIGFVRYSFKNDMALSLTPWTDGRDGAALVVVSDDWALERLAPSLRRVGGEDVKHSIRPDGRIADSGIFLGLAQRIRNSGSSSWFRPLTAGDFHPEAAKMLGNLYDMYVKEASAHWVG